MFGIGNFANSAKQAIIKEFLKFTMTDLNRDLTETDSAIVLMGGGPEGIQAYRINDSKLMDQIVEKGEVMESEETEALKIA